MKTPFFAFTLLILCCSLFAQEPVPVERGARPGSAPPPLEGAGGRLRAVVIGISDYRDPAIPDLQYADKDARAFAQWLRAPEGCHLPDSNIILLENAAATNAQMILALDWLIANSRPGDRAFIYFSGHGDVERVSKFSLGYLLGHDSPSAVYGAGAFSLNYLQAIISTLSENGVQVVVITDACRAGKLAGSSVNGTQVTAMQLAQQFANEIKILSCQPEEYSLESAQWGGGRGLFSYHLEDALYGLADQNADAIVDLRELRRYLEDHVSDEADPQRQTPMVNGPAQVPLARVQDGALAARLSGSKNRNIQFMDVDNKGMESRYLEKSDTLVQRLYSLFLAAVDSGQLLEPAGTSADDYYRQLLGHPQAAPLVGTMKRKLAAALLEEGQTIINQVLKTDPDVLDNIWANRVHYDHLPAYFGRATDILGERHYAYRDLKAKECYFKAMTFRKENYRDSTADWRTVEKRKWLEQSLEWDSSSAIVHLEIGNIYPGPSNEARTYLQKAILLAPEWALAHFLLGVNTTEGAAIHHYKRAIELDSNFLSPYNWISWRYEQIGQPDSAIYWRRQYVNKFLEKMASDSTAIKAYECNDIGNALWRLKDYERAREFLLLGERISNGKMIGIYKHLTVVLTDMLEFENAISTCEKILEQNGQHDWDGDPGNLYFYFLNDTARAKAAWSKAGDRAEGRQIQAWLTMGDAKKAFSLAVENEALYKWEICFLAAESARLLGMSDTAAYYYNHSIDRSSVSLGTKIPFILFKHFCLNALSHYRLGQPEAAQALFDSAAVRQPNDPWLPFYRACYHAQTGQAYEAMAALENAIELGWQPNPLIWLDGTLCDPLLNPIRETDAFKVLVKKHFPRYYDIATRVPGR